MTLNTATMASFKGAAFLKPALISKSAMLAATVCGVFSFAMTEFLTERTIVAGLFSMLAAPACAYFAAKPKILAELNKRRESDHSFAENQMTQLVRRMTQLHQDEVAMLNRELRRRERVENLVRYSKHQALSALDGAESMLHVYSEMLTHLGVGHPPFTKADKKELFAEENKQLLTWGTEAEEVSERREGLNDEY